MPKGRPIPPVTVTQEQRTTLEQWARRPTTAQALAMRARVVLASAAGQPINPIARSADFLDHGQAMARPVPTAWTRRFAG